MELVKYFLMHFLDYNLLEHDPVYFSRHIRKGMCCLHLLCGKEFSPTLNMEAGCSSEPLECTDQMVWHHILKHNSEARNLNIHDRTTLRTSGLHGI
jgi:hypothetical protein